MARVLIVDDTDIVRRALELAVRHMGHSAVSAADAVEALAEAERQPPDLALLDYRMPGMDGAALYRALQAALGERCPRVVWVSATPPDVVTRGGAPAAAFVRKPFHLDELARAVDQVLLAA